jgi:hypothetical protein
MYVVLFSAAPGSMPGGALARGVLSVRCVVCCVGSGDGPNCEHEL